MHSSCIIPTPLYKLSEQQEQHVYEPAEDTFLLLDALEQERAVINAAKPTVALEVGCGAGLVSTFIAEHLNRNGICFATDLNPFAVQCTYETAAMNKNINVAAIQCDLVSGFGSRLDGCVDLLVFNPPYVPTPSEELRTGSLLSKCWAGGPRGRTVIDRFLPSVPRLLNDTGIFYLVAVKENDVAELLTFYGTALAGEIVISRQCGRELLHILKYRR